MHVRITWYMDVIEDCASQSQRYKRGRVQDMGEQGTLRERVHCRKVSSDPRQE